MRVAQLIENLDTGGAESVAVSLANEMAARGHESHLIVVHGGGGLRPAVTPAVIFTDLDRPRTSGFPPSLLAYRLGTCRRLEEVLVRHRIEVVQSHLPQANFLALWIACRRLARVYPTVHNNREFDYGKRTRLKLAARRQAYRLLLRCCDGMVAVSEQVGRSLARELRVQGDRIVAIPNGVVLPDEDDVGGREDHRRAWGLDPDAVLILSIGRLVAQKGHSNLVRALALPGTDPSWRAIVAGEGEERPALEDLVRTCGLQDRVRLVGHVPDIATLMSAADIVCLPSRYEGLSLALLEALAASKAVCAARIEGTADIVTDGREALLADPGDVPALAACLHRLTDDPSLRARLGAAGRELVAQRYTRDRQVAALERLYARERRQGRRRR